MRWRDLRRSDNVEDRRGISAPKMAMGGGLGVLVVALIVWLLGGDPTPLLQQAGPAGGPASASVTPTEFTAQENELADLVSAVLAETEDVWKAQFQAMGRTYKEPKLVLFTGAVQSACGYAQAAMGPFYCPPDAKVYIDLSFYQELKDRHGAGGDFAEAYVITHEVGHHVQNLLGIADEVRRQSARLDEREANALSVRQELQADCFAGLWANHAQRNRQILEEGDIEEALNAASAIGDDRLQKEATGRVVPDAFTHGTSEQRVRWFSQGFRTGELRQCDTFAAGSP
jgi:predicted metalloprotease